MPNVSPAFNIMDCPYIKFFFTMQHTCWKFWRPATLYCLLAFEWHPCIFTTSGIIFLIVNSSCLVHCKQCIALWVTVAQCASCPRFGFAMPTYINLIRDPFERLLSFHCYIRDEQPLPLSSHRRHLFNIVSISHHNFMAAADLLLFLYTVGCGALLLFQYFRECCDKWWPWRWFTFIPHVSKGFECGSFIMHVLMHYMTCDQAQKPWIIHMLAFQTLEKNIHQEVSPHAYIQLKTKVWGSWYK